MQIKEEKKNKSLDPYINHPIELTEILVECEITIEDTNTTYHELVENFGVDIANIVMECTDDKSLDKIIRKKLQISHANKTSDKAKIVKLADKYSNIKSLITDPPVNWSDIINGYLYWANAYFVRL